MIRMTLLLLAAVGGLLNLHREARAQRVAMKWVDLDGGWVTLRTSDGRLIDLPAAQLSRADRRWVRHHLPTRTTAAGPGQARNPSRFSPGRERPVVPNYFLRQISLRWPIAWTTIRDSSRRIS